MIICRLQEMVRLGAASSIMRTGKEKTELLQEKADNLERVKMYAGAEQIDTIICKVKEQERVELQARRYKRSYEAR